MKFVLPILATALTTVTLLAAPETKTYSGVITDTMCGANHAAMNVSPETKCVRDCVKHDRTVRYALFDGKHVYTLSDQEAPAKFAGQRVTVTGQLYTKTNVLKVDTIAAAK